MLIDAPDLRVDPLSLERLRELVEVVGAENAAVFGSLLEIFQREGPLRIQEMQTAIKKNSWEDLLQASHSLKSSSGNLGVERVRRLMVYLEARSRSQDLKGLEIWIERLPEVFAEGEKALAVWVRAQLVGLE
jgi:HPt (histidine-containing phosphotransfer) domain-containing protein